MHDAPPGAPEHERHPCRAARRPSAAPDVYTIHVGAPLGAEWASWLSASEILARDDATGLITAAVRDQAMLFGLLVRIRDLGIPLLGVYPARGTDLPLAGGSGAAERRSQPTPTTPDSGASS